MQYDRGPAIFRIGYIDINLAYFNTLIAPIADIRIENYWPARRSYIGKSI